MAVAFWEWDLCCRGSHTLHIMFCSHHILIVFKHRALEFLLYIKCQKWYRVGAGCQAPIGIMCRALRMTGITAVFLIVLYFCGAIQPTKSVLTEKGRDLVSMQRRLAQLSHRATCSGYFQDRVQDLMLTPSTPLPIQHLIMQK